jgi:2-polyprenyl-3-methyl-5-hydroxy-6-metoxy-1,4-benzoquinol methylase
MTTPQNYDHKRAEYFQVTQQEVAGFVSGKDNRILEIGCGEGYTGAYLKKTGQAKEVHGIELMPAAAQSARQRLDSVITGDLEKIEFPFEHQYFDYILATDTLEHLVEPMNVLKRIKSVLKPNGIIIASVPNMRHIKVLWHLAVEGDWHYQDEGPFDRTHVRFFTRKSFARLFTESGFTVVKTEPVLLKKSQTINKITFGLIKEFLAFRYYCISCLKVDY